jgi:ribonuclease HI
MLIDLEKNKTLIACRLEFDCTSNIIEYEYLIQLLNKFIDLEVKDLKVYGDSEIIVKQVRNHINYVSNQLTRYQQEVWYLLPSFLSFNISFVPCYQNAKN